MENSKDSAPAKESAPASPSLIDQLFGSKRSFPAPPSSTSTISSIFPAPELVVESSQRSRGTSEEVTKIKEDASSGDMSKGRRRSSILDKIEPSPLSSSLYYGCREDMYTRSSNVQSPGSFSEVKKDGDQKEDDSHFASRGDWWEGSLYY